MWTTMKFEHCMIGNEYLLRKSVQDDGNNSLCIYEFIDLAGEREVFTLEIRGEWESMEFEKLMAQMHEVWTHRKKTLEVREDKSESPIETMLFDELQAVFQGEILQHHEFYEKGKLITKPDMYLPEHEICIYCDGHEFHERTKEQAKRDRSVDRWLQANGRIVLRFTGSEIWNEAQKCAEDIINHIR